MGDRRWAAKDIAISAYTLKSYDGPASSLSPTQMLDLKGKIPMDLALASLPGSRGMPIYAGDRTKLTKPAVAAVLAVGGSDSKIDLYTRSDNAEVSGIPGTMF